MTQLTISESALALILLENELQNNYAEVRRWQRRVDEAQQSLNEAKDRLTCNQELLMKVKANISNADCYSRFG